MESVDRLREWSRRYDNNWIDLKTGETIAIYATNGERRPSGAYERFSVNEGERLRELLDEIEREHEKAIAEVSEGCVELPKDSEGEYIHIGDVMEGFNKYDSPSEVSGEVAAIHFNAMMGDLKVETDVGLRVWDEKREYSHISFLNPHASVYRHHHSPTVEDMLYEMYDRLDDPSGDDRNRTIEEIVTEYAAKLQLREGA